MFFHFVDVLSAFSFAFSYIWQDTFTMIHIPLIKILCANKCSTIGISEAFLLYYSNILQVFIVKVSKLFFQ